MPSYTVYYAKSLPMLLDLPTVFEPENYKHVGEWEADDLGHLFHLMQGEQLEKTEHGRALIEACLTPPMIHTSFSVGDVAVDGEKYWICAPFGWDLLRTEQNQEEGGVESASNPVLALLLKHGFDPSIAEGEGLIIEHPDSTADYRRSPLVAVAEGGEYRVAMATFSAGEMHPSLSATYEVEGHRPVRGTSIFREECSPSSAHEQLSGKVLGTYQHSEKVERL